MERSVVAPRFGVRGFVAREADFGSGVLDEAGWDDEGRLDPSRLRRRDAPGPSGSSVHKDVEGGWIPGVGPHHEREIASRRDGRAEALALPDDPSRVRYGAVSDIGV